MDEKGRRSGDYSLLVDLEERERGRENDTSLSMKICDVLFREEKNLIKIIDDITKNNRLNTTTTTTTSTSMKEMEKYFLPMEGKESKIA